MKIEEHNSLMISAGLAVLIRSLAVELNAVGKLDDEALQRTERGANQKIKRTEFNGVNQDEQINC
jgi:hypothetical protein